MIMEALNEHLETLSGYVLDNDKLVTYKWLSKELQVHVNIAKEILWKFYQKYHESNNIECTYLLIGLLKDNGMRVEVVKESDVPKAKEKFNKIISEHIYSVHKPLADLELLANSGSGDVNYSAIKCDACKERSDEEMQLLRWGTVAKKITVGNVVNSKSIDSVNPSKMEKNSVTVNGFNNLFNKIGKSKNPEELKSSLQQKDKDLMKKDNNFSKQKDSAKKNKDSTEKEEVSMEEDEKLTEKRRDLEKKNKDYYKVKGPAEKIKSSMKNNKRSAINSTTKIEPEKSNSMKKDLDNFFEKYTSAPKPAEVISSKEKNNEIKKKLNEKSKVNEKKNLRGKKRNRSKETGETAKKRKRIVAIESDSSDSEIQSDVEMMDSILEPELEIVARPRSPSPPRVKHENSKKRIAKLINKTYKEDGYIVTKKEYIYVSCSEDEEEKKEEEKRRDARKMEAKMEKVKKKQSTLTDFFKKS